MQTSDKGRHPATKPTTYGDLLALLDTKHLPHAKVRNNTYVHRHAVSSLGESLDVKLHGSTIAYVAETGLVLFDAGYRTPTTRSRLNDLLAPYGASVRHEPPNEKWFLVHPDGHETEFQSGMVFRTDSKDAEKGSSR